MKVLALVNYDAAPGSIELREVPRPEAGPDEVVLAVEAAAVCGSDIHVLHGSVSWKMRRPLVIGHEFAGRVVEVGSGDIAVECGARVVSETAAWLDPTSRWSRTGQYNLDPTRRGFGARADGAMAELVRVPVRGLHHLPDAVPFAVGALAEPLCVAYQTVCVQSSVMPGDVVVVIGPGPIGLFCALVAHLAGAGTVIVAGTERDASRTALARSLGASILSTSARATESEVAERTGGVGADLVVDAAGVSATLELALAIVRPAGQITKVGWGPEPVGFSLDALVAKAVTLRGSFSHTWLVWERVLRLIEQHTELVASVIGWSGPLWDWQIGFDLQARGDVVKSVLLPQQRRSAS